tara:strand:- start:11919 stop:12338 length:420 start_codon:yes stop_codon:yes gene_type:complete
MVKRIKHGGRYHFMEDFVGAFLSFGSAGLIKKIKEWPWPKQKKIVDAVITETMDFAAKRELHNLDVWYEKKQILHDRPKRLPKIGENRYYKSTRKKDSKYVYLRIPVNLYSDEGGGFFKVSYKDEKITITKVEGDIYAE